MPQYFGLICLDESPLHCTAFEKLCNVCGIFIKKNEQSLSNDGLLYSHVAEMWEVFGREPSGECLPKVTKLSQK